MTVKELIEILKTCDEKSEVKIEHWNSTIFSIDEVIDYSKELNDVIITIKIVNTDANDLYIIRKAGSNRAGFIKLND